MTIREGTVNKVCILFVCAILTVCCQAMDSHPVVKKSALAGKWYPTSAARLSEMIDEMLAGADNVTSAHGLVFILPHAGYQYSGRVAASGYAAMQKSTPDIIIVMGPSHYRDLSGCALPAARQFETPLGKLKVKQEVVERLHKTGLFTVDKESFGPEHSIEIQLPFIQRVLDGKLPPIVPILVGECTPEKARRIAAAIASSVSGFKRPVFIVSSDFTHYGPRFGYVPFRHKSDADTSKNLSKLDGGAIDAILRKDAAGFDAYVKKTGATICGKNPILVALSLPVQHFVAKKLAYNTSGAITGDYVNSVSYAALMASGTLDRGDGGPSIDERSRKALLGLARRNIESWLKNGKAAAVSPADLPAYCRNRRGAFVTLTIRGRLRGCIGYIEPVKPLWEAVRDMSYNAAFRDPRFSPLTPAELAKIRIEISVLTVPIRVKNVRDVVVGRHGLIMSRGGMRGLLLPQVPTEQRWNLNTFLDETCLKAGLEAGCWKSPSVRIESFEAIVFGEER